MSQYVMQWTWNDGWILMAVHMVRSHGGASLADVIRAADASNHAIPTSQELSRALSKLTGAGVIDVAHGRYEVTGRFAADVAAAYDTEGGLFESGRKGHEWLQSANLEAASESIVGISDGDVKVAYDEYVSKRRNRD